MESTNRRCGNCRHYYITWDKSFPYGCKAMGFKSKALPYALTREVSGQECLSFAPRENAPK
jgi:hypothetical protein